VISKTVGLGSLYEIVKAAGFVPSQDFTDGRISSVTRSHGRFAFSGCQLCCFMRFQRQTVLVLFTRLQRWPVLFFHKISQTAGLGSFYEIAKVAGFFPSRDFIYGQFSSVMRSHGRSAFSGCWLGSVKRFQQRLVLVLFTRLQRLPVLSLLEISLTVGLVQLQDFTGGWR